MNSSSASCWTVGHSSLVEAGHGQGKGVFASRQINAGELIIVEEPMMLVDLDSMMIPTPVEIIAAFRRLKHHHRDSLLSEYTFVASEDQLLEFYNEYAEATDVDYEKKMSRSGRLLLGKVVAIFRNNAHEFGDGTCGFFPNCSRINHSCAPNATIICNSREKRLTIRAAVDIPEGTEITLTYVPEVLIMPKVDRTARLKSYDFTCTCSVCVDPDAAISEQSEARRQELFKLYNQIDGEDHLLTFSLEPKPTSKANADMPSACIRMLEISEQEGYWMNDFKGPVAYKLGMWYCREKKLIEAKQQLEYALPLLKVCRGADDLMTRDCLQTLSSLS